MTTKKIKYFTLLAFFTTIQVVLTFTPLGFLRIGPISATTLHIPVILAGMLLGPKYGAIMGGLFGFCSFINATIAPTLTSFLFTPFYQVGNISGNYYSLLIVFIPRILLGYISGKMFEKLKIENLTIKLIMIASISTFIHTTMVLAMVYIFFYNEYSQLLGISADMLLIMLVGIVLTNGVFEIVLAAVIDSSLYKATYRQVKRMIG